MPRNYEHECQAARDNLLDRHLSEDEELEALDDGDVESLKTEYPEE